VHGLQQAFGEIHAAQFEIDPGEAIGGGHRTGVLISMNTLASLQRPLQQRCGLRIAPLGEVEPADIVQARQRRWMVLAEHRFRQRQRSRRQCEGFRLLSLGDELLDLPVGGIDFGCALCPCMRRGNGELKYNRKQAKQKYRKLDLQHLARQQYWGPNLVGFCLLGMASKGPIVIYQKEGTARRRFRLTPIAVTTPPREPTFWRDTG
jgi:hypothetical protein